MGIFSNLNKILKSTHLHNQKKIRRDRYDEIKKKRKYQVLAEGDSWFNFPSNGKEDIVFFLTSKSNNCAVYSFADHGDTIAEMIGQIKKQKEKWEKRIDKDDVDCIILSGGGNDLFDINEGQTESAFARILRPAPSGADKKEWTSCINQTQLQNVLKEIKESYKKIFAEIQSMSADPLPIFIHGYAYPVPTGKGYVAKVSDLVTIKKGEGWIKPVFDGKGYEKKPRRMEAILNKILGDFNTMLQGLAQGKVFYVDVRPLVDSEDWRDEFHLKPSACKKVAQELADSIKANV